MKKHFLLLIVLFSFIISRAQQTETKYYPKNTLAGRATVLYSYGENISGKSCKVYVVSVPETGYYYIAGLVNMRLGQGFKVYADGTAVEYLYPNRDGWQYRSLPVSVKLTAGKHTILFAGTDGLVPMVDELFLNFTLTERSSGAPPAVTTFLDKIDALKQQSIINSLTASSENESVSKVLPNPEGEYAHAIDTAFSYSHFSWIYLPAGSHIFKTENSTVGRSLTIFNTANYTQSWSNYNGGANGESYLSIYTTSGSYFAIALRAIVNGQTGTTNITYNGDPLVNGAVIGGKTYAMSALRGGPMNFFTCKLTAGDTRVIVSRYFASSARAYNDDYSGGGGSWNWGLASRIKKDFTGSDSVQYTFVCSYSPSSTGICDIYMGCGNSNVPLLEPQNFPLLTQDDAIRSAPATGGYNCIAWSGGVTGAWIWPPSALSTYNCTSANYLQCFDNFYSNNPVRYPGAWNYTRTGATEANSVVDLWKTATAYTHASVKKPGNNHPHGYDWESKPGGLNRTLHPRYALTQANWYGSVSNYYKPTGTYARNADNQQAFSSDADAVKAGVAIFDKATLSSEAVEKLKNLLLKTGKSITASFDELYNQWDATKAAHASLSDPAAYCTNKEYKALETFALANRRPAMLLAFDKFIKGDHLIGELVLTLTMDKYSRLLEEVKAERLANPNDKEGRYRIHGDHDNGVLYIEKILKDLQDEPTTQPVTDAVSVTVSPNPVTDKLTLLLVTKKESRVSITITSAQTGAKQVMQKETMLAAGTHRFETSVKDIAGNSGNMLAVQVMADGVLKIVKVMVMK